MEINKKRIIKKYTFIFCISCIILISIFFIIKYQVEGEKDMPYKLKEVIIKSSINSLNVDSNNLWDLELSQANDIYLYIESDKEKNKNEKIQRVNIENIEVKNYKRKDNIEVLLPTGNSLKNIYDNSTKDYRNENIEYIASSIDSLENHEICENGGMVALRIYNKNIGTYKSTKDKKIIYDGSLLKKANINEEDLKKVKNVLKSENIEYTYNLSYKKKVTLDVDGDSKEETIYAISNVFTSEPNQKFSIVFIDNDGIEVLYKDVKKPSKMYEMCMPKVKFIIDIDKDLKYEIITECTYFSVMGSCDSLYKIKNNSYKKFKGC